MAEDAKQQYRWADSGLPIGFCNRIADLLAAVMVLLAVAWALSLQRQIGLDLYPQQYFAAILALVLPVAFIKLPLRRRAHGQDADGGAGRQGERIPFYDIALALLGFATCAYIAVFYPALVLKIFVASPDLWIPGLVFMVLVLEALRRATGWPLVLIILGFLLYALFGDILPGRLKGRPQTWEVLTGYMATDSNGMLGLPVSIASTVVMAFIFFGVLLGMTGGARFFTDAAILGMGRFRGGSMKIAVLASGFFGSISGSAVANVVATGVVTIPMIKRSGYKAHKAAAIEAVASTGGQLMPPIMGAAAFLMAEFLATPYRDIVLAALVPGLLYYLALFIQADLEAARLGIRAIPESEMPPRRQVLRGVHFFAAFAALFYFLFWKNYQPDRAALWSIGVLVITAAAIGYGGERFRLRDIFAGLARTGHAVVEILLISAAAGIVIGVLNISGLSFNLTYLLVQIGGDNGALLLLLSAIVCIILGMGLPTLGVYVLLAALVAPALIKVGIHPIAAHLYVLYFGMMSMITPPIALAAFAAAAIAKSPAMQTGWAAVRFGWIAYLIPVLFVASPTLILIGNGVDITANIITTIFGVWFICIALAGFFMRSLGVAMRLGFLATGMAALVPVDAIPYGYAANAAAILLGMVLMPFAARKAAAQ